MKWNRKLERFQMDSSHPLQWGESFSNNQALVDGNESTQVTIEETNK